MNPIQESDAMTKTREAMSKLNLDPETYKITLKEVGAWILIEFCDLSEPRVVCSFWFIYSNLKDGFGQIETQVGCMRRNWESLEEVVDSIGKVVEWYKVIKLRQ